MKNRKLYAFVGILVVFALSLTACSSKGKFAVAGISDQYKGSYIMGFEDSGDYIFAASASSLEDIKGVAIKGTSVILNVFESVDTGTFAPFLGEATILRGNLMIIIMDSEDLSYGNTNSTKEFINNKVVNFENGAARVNLAIDFEKF